MAPLPKMRLDRVREADGITHDPRHPEHASVTWITRDMVFHNPRHPKDLGAAAIDALVTQLVGQEHTGL